MKKKLSAALAILMTITMLPISTFAAAIDFDLSDSGCDYYNLIEQTDYALAPGATESEIVINDDSGSNRNMMHVIEVDLKDPNISVMPTYMGLKEGIDFEDSSTWGSQKLTEQAAHVENDLGLNVVGGINTNLRYGNDHPYGVLVWNGVVYSDERNSKGVSTAQTFLSVTKDGVASLHSASEPIPKDSYNAISANFDWIIEDGVVASKYAKDDHADASRAPRTVIGIKESGELILMMNDGRQSPFSAGMTMKELAEVLLAMGCVDAVNCDGGGSSTFISEREGTGELTMKSSPSDGDQRATLGGLLVISKAAKDGKFDHATIKADSTSQYVTPGSTVEFTAVGADSAGGPADIPEDALWKLADDSMGTIKDGVFVSNGKEGTAVAQLVYNGEVVGEDSVEVVIPTAVKFTKAVVTVPYGKRVKLEVKATVNDGLNEVTLKDGDILLDISDKKLGTLNGFEFIAPDSTEGVTEGNVMATFVGTDITGTATIRLGKGSEIVEDFEDKEYSYTIKSMYNGGDTSSLELVTAETGMVKNGDYAMAVNINFSDYTLYGGRGGINIWNWGLDNLKDASAIGFWIYIPEDAHGIWAQFRTFDAGSGSKTGKQSPALMPGGYTYSIERNGWYYVKADLTKCNSPVEINHLQFYVEDYVDYKDYGYVASENKNQAGKMTFFIDDVTVDYSNAVEDREGPEFEPVYVSYGDIEAAEMKGQTINNNKVSITVQAKDYVADNAVGLDTSSAKAFIDGVDVSDKLTCSTNGLLKLMGIELSEGNHVFNFEISDSNGNPGHIERTLIVDATEDKAPVIIEATNPQANYIPSGALYWIDVKSTDVKNFKSVTTVVDLIGIHDWELEHMDVADGFEATYSIDKYTNNATITITKTGSVDATGEYVLASLPIRTWAAKENSATDGSNDDGEGRWIKQIVVNTDYGVVTYKDDTTQSFTMSPIVVDTENYVCTSFATTTELATLDAWHIHKTEVIEDKEATCKQEGYIGRTVCVGCNCVDNTDADACKDEAGCGSVVEWGETIPATGHTYKVINGKIACEDCGAVDETTGFVTMDENIYYAIKGKLSSGWVVDKDNYYYFDTETYAAKKDGVYRIDKYDYTFDENGILTLGQWVRVISDGEFKMKYMYAGKYIVSHFKDIDGKTYWFDKNGFMATGTQVLKLSGGDKGAIYEIGSDGVVTGIIDYTGSYTCQDVAYGVVDGKLIDKGLFVNEGNTYFCDNDNGILSTGKVYVDGCYTTEDIAEGWHYFDETGRMYDEEFVYYDDILYYMKNGQPAKSGVFEIDDKLYYAEWNGSIKTGKISVTDSTSNGLLEAGDYYFSGTGAICNNEFIEDSGNIYYVVNGQPGKTGAFEVDGSLYYASWKGVVQTGKIYITEATANGLVEAGWYYTDEAGKLYNKEFAEVDGVTYYMVGGKPDKQTGIVEINDSLYYLNSKGAIEIGKVYVTEAASNDLGAGWYYTDETGRLYNDEFTTIDDKVYYMVKGQPKKQSGVVEIDGSLYCAEWNGAIRAGKIYVTEDSANKLVSAGWYYTDSTGRFYNNEFTTIESRIYYMVNGQPKKQSGVVEIDGSLYCAEWNGAIRTGKIYITEDSSNGTVTAGWSYTDETGRLYDQEFATIDGKIYYMEKGQPKKQSGVVEIDGSLYCAEWNGAVRTGKIYITEASSNGIVEEGWHYTDENGRMYNEEVAEVDGTLYYFVNGQPGGATGVVKSNDDLYYVAWDGKVQTGKVYITSATTNDLTVEGWHYTDENGRLYNNEFVEIDGELYYIVNGQIAKLGVFEIDGALYYADTWNGKLAKDGKVYVTVDSANKLINWGFHTFDVNGKMID